MRDFLLLLYFQYHAFSYITSILNSERFSVEEQERLKEEAFTQLEVINRIYLGEGLRYCLQFLAGFFNGLVGGRRPQLG